jgi:hypothetical protein
VVTLYVPWCLNTVTKYGLMHKAIRFVLTNLIATYRHGGKVIRTVVNHGGPRWHSNKSIHFKNKYPHFFLFFIITNKCTIIKVYSISQQSLCVICCDIYFYVKIVHLLDIIKIAKMHGTHIKIKNPHIYFWEPSWTSWPLKMEPIVCPETSENNCKHMLPQNPKERGSHILNLVQ